MLPQIGLADYRYNCINCLIVRVVLSPCVVEVIVGRLQPDSISPLQDVTDW